MAIYGTAILSFCLIVGLFVGRSLGAALGISNDVGGVGIAMLLLVLVTDRMRRSDSLKEATESGIQFWSALYVPIIVAMAAGMNVKAAISSGPAAILAGTLAVAVCLALVPVVGRIGKPTGSDED
ncbi:MAG: malonate transporter subunit MadL [Verrucomicrobiota bacterium]